MELEVRLVAQRERNDNELEMGPLERRRKARAEAAEEEHFHDMGMAETAMGPQDWEVQDRKRLKVCFLKNHYLMDLLHSKVMELLEVRLGDLFHSEVMNLLKVRLEHLMVWESLIHLRTSTLNRN